MYYIYLFIKVNISEDIIVLYRIEVVKLRCCVVATLKVAPGDHWDVGIFAHFIEASIAKIKKSVSESMAAG